MLEDCYFRVWLLVFLPFFFFFSTNTCCVHNCELLLLVQNLWRQKLHTMKCPEMKQVLWCFASSRNQPRWSIFSSLEKLLPSSFQDWRCYSLLFLLAVELHTILNSTYTYALICIWFLSVNLMSVRAIHVIHSSASDFSSFFFFSESYPMAICRPSVPVSFIQLFFPPLFSASAQLTIRLPIFMLVTELRRQSQIDFPMLNPPHVSGQKAIVSFFLYGWVWFINRAPDSREFSLGTSLHLVISGEGHS